MQARETTIRELIQGQRQFVIPLFQRPYTWKRDQLNTLWQDILGEYDQLGTAGVNHFIGSFVLAPIPSAASQPVKPLLVVDGQQRLITLLIALCAVRDALADTDPQAFERYNDLYLINKWQQGQSKYRLIPTQSDRDSFYACVDAEPTKMGQGRVAETYSFFAGQLQLLDRNGKQLDLERITTVITDRLAIVDITTGANDNVHRIFESLNAKGARLTQGDLIRNYIFMLLPTSQETVYQSLWRPMEDLLGVANLAGFARVEMQRDGKEVAVPDVYKEFQRRLNPLTGNEASIKNAVAELARMAPYYKRLIAPASEPDKLVRSHLEFLTTWGAQTSHPLIMFVYDLLDRQLCGIQQLREVLSYVESYLVRRQLQGIPTNALNWLFVRLIPELPSNTSVADAVRNELSGRRRYWPTDEQIKEAVKTRPFYLTGRGAQQMLILRRLERSYKHPEPVDLERANLTIEHIMPQTLTAEWRRQLTELGQDPDEVHDEFLHTLGNLTLTAYNSPLSNNPFARKKQILKGSNLELNKALRENDMWGRDEILKRANDLARRVCKIWVAPLPVADDEPSGFDWTLVNAAVEAIPAGQWTTFGDLAALSGTSAAAVGVHLASSSAPIHGYRVLTAGGKPNLEFKLRKKKGGRNVVDLLAAEGLGLDESGNASPDTRLRTADLSKLVVIPSEEEPLKDPEEALA